MRGRKRLLAGLLAILMAFAGLSLYSMKKNAAESGDYQYVVNEDGASLTITKYTGSLYDRITIFPTVISSISLCHLDAL